MARRAWAPGLTPPRACSARPLALLWLVGFDPGRDVVRDDVHLGLKPRPFCPRSGRRRTIVSIVQIVTALSAWAVEPLGHVPAAARAAEAVDPVDELELWGSHKATIGCWRAPGRRYRQLPLGRLDTLTMRALAATRPSTPRPPGTTPGTPRGTSCTLGNLVTYAKATSVLRVDERSRAKTPFSRLQRQQDSRRYWSGHLSVFCCSVFCCHAARRRACSSFRARSNETPSATQSSSSMSMASVEGTVRRGRSQRQSPATGSCPQFAQACTAGGGPPAPTGRSLTKPLLAPGKTDGGRRATACLRCVPQARQRRSQWPLRWSQAQQVQSYGPGRPATELSGTDDL